MNNASRIAVTAAAFSALTAIACSSSFTDTAPSVEVEQGTVDPNCVKGGTTCGLPGGSSGLASSSGYVSSSSGFMLDPGTSGSPPPPPPPLQPPSGVDPINCGERCTATLDRKGHPACDCSGGAGNGLQSGIVCPVTAPCRYQVNGFYRCYRTDYGTDQCH